MKKKYIYTIHIEDKNICNVIELKADSYREAAEKAKNKFIRENWQRKFLRTKMTDKTDNVS